MPELPDITIYIEALRPRVLGQRLDRVRIKSPFLLRTFEPSIDAAAGRTVMDISRLGKRIVLGLGGDLFLVIHLMIAGRLLWKDPGRGPTGKIDLATFEFATGTLLLTEASQKRRASLHVIQGAAGLRALDAGGIDVLAATPAELATALRRENRTLKRALTDPRTVSGIGNAYSDEILHRAKLSPLAMTANLSAVDTERLFHAVQSTLQDWIDRLRMETAGGFPEKVTAFREAMAVHGRYGEPCPVCGAPVQRIVYAENEVNYCARCQTDGKVLADRSLSRLLKKSWPRSIDELE